MTILEKVKDTIAKYGMLKSGDKVLVCVSGGADSVALLHILNSLAGEIGISLHIAHLDHMIRQRESYEDMLFVQRLARVLSIPVTVSRINIPQIIKERGSSLEDTARDERYGFFLKVASKIKANRIATAHTMDDQAETVLMRLLRGSGVTGLRGIPPKRKAGSATIIRPVIRIWRSQIEGYLKENNIDFRYDSSNLDTGILRNRLRLKLLPLLKKDYNPNISEVLANIAENLNDTFEYMEKEARSAFLDSMERTHQGEVVLSLNKLFKKSLAIQKEVVRMAIKELKGDLNRITYSHWQDIESLIEEKSTGASLDLPDGIRCIKEYGRLIFCKGKGKVPIPWRGGFPLQKGAFPVQLPGPLAGRVPTITDIPEMGLEVATRILLRNGKKLSKRLNGKTAAFFDLDKIVLPLALRYKRDGDRFVPLGMKGSKKLKDLFIDEKVPRGMRERMPVVVTGYMPQSNLGVHEKIIWVPPLRIADEVKVTGETKRVLKMSISNLIA